MPKISPLSAKLRHKNCGGLVEEDWSRTYDYQDDDGKVEQIPAHVCQKCGNEILGDAETYFDTGEV